MNAINPHWRVLTIGDGDLSFSAALAKKLASGHLTATVFDSLQTLSGKYGLAHYQQLKSLGVDVVTSVDVTDPQTWQEIGQSNQSKFDLVIFQFPLIPNGFSASQYQQLSEQGSTNTLNRWLLHCFVKHCFEHFLAPDGQRLAVITSKDVKPYRQWNIETSLLKGLTGRYLGRSNFDIESFNGYQVRNVDRDKFVKDTQAYSYYFSDKPQELLETELEIPAYCDDPQYCAMCRVGPIETQQDWQAHLISKRHVKMDEFEQQWHSWLALREC